MKKLRLLFKNSLFKETSIYGITNAIFTGLPLFLMPFLVSVLSPDDYGTLELFKSITLILTPSLGFSTIQSLSRYYYDLDKKPYEAFFSSVLLLNFINGVVLLVLLFVLSFFIGSDYYVIIYYAIIYFIFNQATESLLVYYRVLKKVKKYMRIRLSCILLDLGLLTIFYFTYKHYDWTYRVLPNILATFVIGLISVYTIYIKYRFKFTFKVSMVRESIKYSAPLILHMIAGYILNMGDRFFVLHYLGDKELGNYSVAYQIGMSISFFYTSFNLAWTPTFYEWMKAERYDAINKVKKIVFTAIPLIAFVIIAAWLIISPYIPNFAKYHVPIMLILIVLFSYIFLAFYKFNANYFFYSKNTKKLAVITVLTSVTSILLNFVFIPKWGLYGAALVTLITFSAMYILTLKAQNHETYR